MCPASPPGTISATGSATVMGGDLEESTTATVAAVKPEFADVSNLSLAIGDFITEEDDENVSKVAVIGYDLAVEIFGSPMEAFDNTIVIDDRNYTVAGVLQEMAPWPPASAQTARYSSLTPPALNTCWGGVSAPPSPWLRRM